ncbi:MAG TPA: ABC transporter permease [Symbiobacteriaceae bacterium]|jgi:NitT/TauT family transport system permease protein
MAKLALRLGVILGFLLLWQGVAWLGVWPPYLFPSPLDVGRTLWQLTESGTLLPAVLVTLRRILVGFVLASVGGVLLGFGLARSQWLSTTFGPVVLGLQGMPSICWFPLAILWIGLNEGAILFVTTVGALFAIAATTESAIRNIPPVYLHAASTMGARGLRLYTRVILPAAMPALLTGLRVGWSFAWRSLMAAELLIMNLGLGFLLEMGRNLADAAQVVGVILVILALGLVVDRLVFARFERRVRQRWGFEP